MPAVGEVFQYTFTQSYVGQTTENVIHFRARTIGTPTAADLRAVADRWVAHMATVQVTALQYRATRIKQMTPIGFDEMLHLSPTLTGTIGAAGAPTTIAAVITKRTGTAGKSHRGRMYLAGFPAGWGSDIISVGSGPADIANYANLLLTKFGDAGDDPTMVAGVYSRTIGGEFPFTLAGWQAITRWDPQLLLGNQRRRRLFVGI